MFLFLANSYVFGIHGTNTEQTNSLKMRKKISLPIKVGFLIILRNESRHFRQRELMLFLTSPRLN